MRGPEVKQRVPAVYEISAERAITNAATLAIKNNSNVGLRYLFDGVRAEIGDFLVGSDLNRKRVDTKQLENDLELLEYCGDTVKQSSQLETGLSSSATSAIDHALNRARLRKNPMTQRPSARDLLESIAAVSHEEAGKLALVYIRSHPHPDPEKQQELIRKEELRINLPKSGKPIYLLKIDKPLSFKI